MIMTPPRDYNIPKCFSRARLPTASHFSPGAQKRKLLLICHGRIPVFQRNSHSLLAKFSSFVPDEFLRDKINIRCLRGRKKKYKKIRCDAIYLTTIALFLVTNRKKKNKRNRFVRKIWERNISSPIERSYFFKIK